MHDASAPLWVTLLFIVFFGSLKIWGCPDHHGAVEVLKAEGYSEITTEAWHGWSCGNDGRATGFRATSAAGAKVRGVVCSGVWAKAYTVRIESVAR